MNHRERPEANGRNWQSRASMQYDIQTFSSRDDAEIPLGKQQRVAAVLAGKLFVCRNNDIEKRRVETLQTAVQEQRLVRIETELPADLVQS